MTADISRPEMSSLAGFIIVCCVGAALVERLGVYDKGVSVCRKTEGLCQGRL